MITADTRMIRSASTEHHLWEHGEHGIMSPGANGSHGRKEGTHRDTDVVWSPIMSEQTYNMSQGYDSLAAELLYAAMNGSSAEELAFYERHIRANGGPALDLACGTGRHLFPLLEHGLEVHGADASADALQFARMRAKEDQVNPPLYHQRMEELDVPHRYGTIYIPNGSFHLISHRHHAFGALERFRKHLIPGGQLLIEIVAPKEVIDTYRLRDAEHPDSWGPAARRGGEGEISTTLWTESIDLFEQTLVEKRRYDLHVGGQLVRSEDHTLHMRWYAKYEWVMMLESVGFEEIALYADYEDLPVTQGSQTIVYGAQNPRL